MRCVSVRAHGSSLTHVEKKVVKSNFLAKGGVILDFFSVLGSFFLSVLR